MKFLSQFLILCFVVAVFGCSDDDEETMLNQVGNWEGIKIQIYTDSTGAEVKIDTIEMAVEFEKNNTGNISFPTQEIELAEWDVSSAEQTINWIGKITRPDNTVFEISYRFNIQIDTDDQQKWNRFLKTFAAEFEEVVDEEELWILNKIE